MTISPGILEYEIGSQPVTGCGFSYSVAELDMALSGPVAEIVFDDSGKADIQELFAGVTGTNFGKDRIEQVLSSPVKLKDWRVGEALAEAYLVEQRDCIFPWPIGRDERKSGSSLPGADLVGFQLKGGSWIFAFGEAKTSSDEQSPPRVMYGHTGMKQQLKDLKNSEQIRDGLVEYLAYRAVNAPWRPQFQSAYENYVKNRAKVCILGFLVRDVSPNEDDLRAGVTRLSQNQHQGMVIELLALYLPENSVSTLSSKVSNSRSGTQGGKFGKGGTV